MSRSYKRAIIQDDGCKEWGKRAANKKVRRTPTVPDGGGYKKVFESWSISDYMFDLRWGEKPCRGAVRTRKGWVVPK